MNQFTPQRLANESQHEYQARRAHAKQAVRAMRCVGLGDQRKESSQREQTRDAARRRGTLKGHYGSDIVSAQSTRNQMRGEAIHKLRDDRGAYTLTGSEFSVFGMTAGAEVHVTSAGQDHGEPFYTGRRKWLAGVSAQRGY